MKLIVVLMTVVLFLSISAINAETHITGDISAMSLDISGTPYIVEQDIMIPEGKKVVIKEGCVFLFKPFTGLTVQGQLVVEGTQENQVIFSSINDGDLNPASEQLANPFDWNGILVLRESGTVVFSNIALRYSVYGIKSQNPNIQITNGLFRQNGQFHFTINDKIQFVQDNIPYSFNGSDDFTNTTIKPVAGNDPQTTNQVSKGRLVLRYTSLCFGVAGAVTGIVFGAQIPGAWSDWTDAGSNYSKLNYKTTERIALQKVRGASIGGGFGVVGLSIFGLTFLK